MIHLGVPHGGREIGFPRIFVEKRYSSHEGAMNDPNEEENTTDDAESGPAGEGLPFDPVMDVERRKSDDESDEAVRVSSLVILGSNGVRACDTIWRRKLRL